MYRHLFRNRWIALAFVLMTVASAASLVGTEDHDGVIDKATAQLHDQKAQFAAEAEELAKPTRSHTVITLDEPPPEDAEELNDEDLIDPGTGIDPTPMDNSGFEPVPDHTPAPMVEP